MDSKDVPQDNSHDDLSLFLSEQEALLASNLYLDEASNDLDLGLDHRQDANSATLAEQIEVTSPIPLPPIQIPPNVDPRMLLAMEELQWAHQIKQAIYNHQQPNMERNNNDGPDIQTVADYEIAQWAIVTFNKQSLDKVMERVLKMQRFREQYNLKQSTCPDFLEEGMTLITAMIDQQPGLFLSVDFLAEHGNYLLVTDYAAFSPTAVQNPNDWKAFSGGFFYLYQLMNSNFQAVRKGVSIITECMGMGFGNFNPQVEERWMNEFNYYPINHKDSLWLHTPFIANVIYTFVEPFMSEEMKNSFHLGCDLEGYEGSIGVLFQTPTPEAAKANLLQQLRGYLLERQINQSTYRLPPLPTSSS